MDRDDEYRRHAAECQHMAANTRNKTDKSRWLKMAEEWLRMIRGKSSHSPASEAFDAEKADKGTGQKESDSSH